MGSCLAAIARSEEVAEKWALAFKVKVRGAVGVGLGLGLGLGVGLGLGLDKWVLAAALSIGSPPWAVPWALGRVPCMACEPWPPSGLDVRCSPPSPPDVGPAPDRASGCEPLLRLRLGVRGRGRVRCRGRGRGRVGVRARVKARFSS